MSHNSYDTHLLLQNLMDNTRDCIYFKDLQSNFILVNKAAAIWQGCDTPERVVGKTDFDFYEAADARSMLEAERRIIETGEPLGGFEEKETLKGGETAWVSSTKMPLRNSEREIVGTFGISRDITEHKEAELRSQRYVEEIRRIKEQMEEEVRMASELQKSFFPRSYPVYPASVSPAESAVQFHYLCQASGMVSGDFCSVHRLSETECGVLLCDVMGHGVRAALGTALIYSMAGELMQIERDPGRFLERMNELLLPILRQEDAFLYATACYAVFDAATGQLRVANAGHPVPLHFVAEEKTAGWLVGDEAWRGPALAIFEEAEYSVAELNIHPGDTVVLYTDGLYEAEGAGNEEFGEERLLRAAQRHADLSLSALFPALIDEARRFSQNDAFDDDVCLVGLTYQTPLES